jgi:hypothetical protein
VLGDPEPEQLDALPVLRELDAGTRDPDDEDEDDDDDEDDDEGDRPPAWPGPAEPVPGPDPTWADIRVTAPGTLVLVPATRPSDVPAAIGWMGAANADVLGARMSAVLRSWEDRFGATLVGIDGDTLWVVPGRLPAAADQLARLAGEHYLLCPDTIDQGIPWNDYLAELPRLPVWTFWWD